MRDVVIVSATRTAIGDFGGALKDLSATSLAMAIIESSIQRAGIERRFVDQVIMGNCFEPLDQNVARIAWVKCGLHPRDGKKESQFGPCCPLRWRGIGIRYGG